MHVPSGWFVVRVPLLPFDELLAWGRQVAASPATVRPEAVGRPEVREAVYVASPSLDASIGADATLGGHRADTALIRYFLRMTGRPTPFGLFATCTLGQLGEQTRLAVAPRESIRRRTRLDAGYLTSLGAAWSDEQAVRDRLTMRPNNTVCRVGDRLRFVERRRDAGGYRLVTVAASEPLVDLLDRAAGGVPFEDLVGALVAAGHDHGEAHRFVGEVAGAQLLLSGLEPPVTGADGLTRLREELPDDACGRPVLSTVAGMLAAIDGRGLGNRAEDYRAVAAALAPLPVRVDEARLFQVDAVRPAASASLGPAVVDDVRHGVEVLHRAGRPWRDAGLERFRREFAHRYGAQWIPVLLALDEESGVGYLPADESVAEPAPLLDGLTAFDRPGARVLAWRAREDHLLRLLHDAWAAGTTEIVLDDGDVAALSHPAVAPLPDAFAAVCSVAATPDGAADRGDFRVCLDCAAGPSGVRLLARFCDLDPALGAAVRAHVRAEESLLPHAAFAEVVHRPQGRLGNVLHRPVLRDWEIPVLDGSGVSEERTIALRDLLVTVADGRIQLFSTALDRVVIPRLSNAHDYYSDSGIGLYSFLCALQNEGTTGTLRWSWEPFHEAPFLPRVRHGRVVLSRARWRLSATEVRRLFAAGLPVADRVRALRAERRLPRFVHLDDKHGELVTDLDNPRAVEAAFSILEPHRSATLVELFGDSDHLVAQGPDGGYVHELVVPFHRSGPAEARPGPHPRPVPRDRRDFPPGSEWLFVKVYCDRAGADRLLTGPVADLVRAGTADRWFFVRYADPDPHVRLRFHATPAILREVCRPLVEATLGREFDAGRVHAVRYDVYRREVERYGGPDGVAVAERMFQADSEAVLALLPHVTGDAGGVRRWETALLGIDRSLADLGVDRSHVVGRMRASLEREFDVGPAGRAEILARLRPHRGRLLRLLQAGADGRPDPDPARQAATRALEERSIRWRPHVETLRRLDASGALTEPLDALAGSLVHMSLNRLLRGAHRRQELVLTTFLDRLYDSLRARG